MTTYEQELWDLMFNDYIYMKESPLSALLPALMQYDKYLDMHSAPLGTTIRILGFDITKR